MKQNHDFTYHLSYWERETFFKNIDVAIIGSGIVGLSTAISLKEQDAGLNVVVLERGGLPVGASTRNAGFGCVGSLSELMEDLSQMDEAAVWDLVAHRWEGLLLLRERLGDEAIQYKEYGGYEIFRKKEVPLYKECVQRLGYFNRKMYEVTGLQDAFRRWDRKIGAFGLEGVQHLILNTSEGQLHTGYMMRALIHKARELGVSVINGIEIQEMEEGTDFVRLQTQYGWTISAEKVIVATNGFAKKLLPNLAVQPARNQVLITAPILGLRIRGAFHNDKGYFYFRNIHNRVLLGGGRNLAKEAEQTSEFGTTEQIQNHLLELLENVILPHTSFTIDSWWSGILGVGDQKRPIVDEVSDRVIVAVRMGGMGVAIGSIVGEAAANLVL